MAIFMAILHLPAWLSTESDMKRSGNRPFLAKTFVWQGAWGNVTSRSHQGKGLLRCGRCPHRAICLAVVLVVVQSSGVLK